MATYTWYHCKEEIEEGTQHHCWTTTEENLTGGLSEDLIEAWERCADGHRLRRAEDLRLECPYEHSATSTEADSAG